MKILTKLLNAHRKFPALTIISCSVYVILFLVLLLLSTPHPILTFLVIASVAPGCWLLVHILFKYKAKLEKDINTLLIKIIRQEFQKELDKRNIRCLFDVKPVRFNSKNIAKDFYFYYSDPDMKLYKSILFSTSKVIQKVNALLTNLHKIDIFAKEDSTLRVDIVV